LFEIQVKVKFTLEQATKAQGESRDTAQLYSFFTSALDGGGWSSPRFAPAERGPVPIVQETGRALWPVWTVAENLAPFGIRFPARPARTESLYGLRFLGHCLKQYWIRSGMWNLIEW